MKRGQGHRKQRAHRKAQGAARQRLEVRQPSAAFQMLRQRLDTEIEIGLEQLKRGEKIPDRTVYKGIRERNQRRHVS